MRARGPTNRALATARYPAGHPSLSYSFLFLSFSFYMYIYLLVCICVYVCVCVWVCIDGLKILDFFYCYLPSPQISLVQHGHHPNHQSKSHYWNRAPLMQLLLSACITLIVFIYDFLFSSFIKRKWREGKRNPSCNKRASSCAHRIIYTHTHTFSIQYRYIYFLNI